VVRQVAGLIARRIVTDLTVGQELLAGGRIGMIKFGSRLELMVPAELIGRVRVRVGQSVRAGLTVMVAQPGEADNA
jgi:phosphatidylserine decarboxylase